MKKYFYNILENRLKAGWRILLFAILFWGLSALIFVIKPLFGNITKRAFLSHYSVVIVAILALAATFAVAVSRIKLDKLSIVSLGLPINKRTWQDLLFGFVLSGLMAGLFFAVVVLFGLVEFQGFNFGETPKTTEHITSFVRFMSIVSIGSLAILFLEHVLVGYWEEIVFRGYIFQNMVAGIGLRWAIGISCILYGLIHAANPNAGMLSTSIIMLFGFLRIYGYLSTQMLWLSMGMHIGWNFFQGPIFGFAASGYRHSTLIKLTPTGQNWLTGGAFGPEGSILIIPIIVLALAIIRWWAQMQAGKHVV